ncbi:glycosyltransferase family 1 protein [Priestia aryabhattai]|uniref:glycosyltransferase family protein n=1 Tax=Priestia aryabhattai TaxID=412384 RepID=UPI001C8E61A9|nr:glycosyltransferase [Priestia aryabhattai]MBX9968378.1 glycosyltransferase family 1 protein [Priestia aryabhattai]
MSDKNQLKILILTKEFDKLYPKQKPKYDFFRSVEKFAEVRYWHKDGEINFILENLDFTPDFIFHYDITGYAFSPKITGLDNIEIPKGTYVIDEHWNPTERRKYFNDNKIDLIFSATKEAFLKRYPSYKDKFRFLPLSINPALIKDWNIDRDIDFLLMGLLSTGSYPFRKAVLNKFENEKGFVHYPHPGHTTKDVNAIINERYAKELNRTKIFFTCGSKYKYPVAKFFEALGCNTLLLAKPNNDIYELGFKDGENFIACDCSTVYQKAIYYLSNQEERERISMNGYRFVHQYHTNDVRAKEFLSSLYTFLEKKNGGTTNESQI